MKELEVKVSQSHLEQIKSFLELPHTNLPFPVHNLLLQVVEKLEVIPKIPSVGVEPIRSRFKRPEPPLSFGLVDPSTNELFHVNSTHDPVKSYKSVLTKKVKQKRITEIMSRGFIPQLVYNKSKYTPQDDVKCAPWYQALVEEVKNKNRQ